MKRIIVIALSVFSVVSLASAQGMKFGHINMQEVMFLMDEMDSARVAIEKRDKELMDNYNAMRQEFDTKYRTYQEMGANWSPSVLASKEQELSDIQNRIMEFDQQRQAEMYSLQQQLMGPIQKKANDAVAKVGRANGLVYVFDVSMGVIPYFDAAQSMDVTEQVKIELNIPLDKMLPQAQPQR